MRMAGYLLGALLLALPVAGANDPLNDPVCEPNLGCYGDLVCVTAVFCQVERCDPAASCRSHVNRSRACAVNESIQGRTCQDEVAVRAGAARASGVGPDMGETSLAASVVLAEGNVSARQLTNAWFSHGASVDAVVLGQDLGTTRVALYRSVIDLDGSRGAAHTLLFPDANHTFSQVGVEVRQSALGAHVVAGVFLLDLAPEGCFASTSVPEADYARCPRLPSLP